MRRRQLYGFGRTRVATRLPLVVVAVVGLALAVLIWSGGAQADVSPAGCNTNNMTLGISRLPSGTVINGQIITYTVSAANPGGGLGTSCDVTNVLVIFTCPGLDGTPSGTETTLSGAGGDNFPADSSGNKTYPSVACTINVTSPGTTTVTGKAEAGFNNINDGRLHDSTNDDSFDRINSVSNAFATTGVQASPTTIIAGRSTTVSWTSIVSPTPKDWIGLYASPGAADTAFLVFQYTDGTSNGSHEQFLVPYGTAPGTTYQFRLFSNDGFTQLASSAAITITATTVTFSFSAGPIINGNSSVLSWSGITAPSPTDWVGLYPSASATDDAFIAFRYTNSTTSFGGMPFNIPAGTAPGTTYEFRLFTDNGFTRIRPPSAPFTVT
jgi:hypothetical protein